MKLGKLKFWQYEDMRPGTVWVDKMRYDLLYDVIYWEVQK
jgi:hypothetical protein